MPFDDGAPDAGTLRLGAAQPARVGTSCAARGRDEDTELEDVATFPVPGQGAVAAGRRRFHRILRGDCEYGSNGRTPLAEL